MQTRVQNHRGGFTLLEMVVVLTIVALLLSAIYTIASGTLTLADDVRRTQARENRQQAFTMFCEHQFGSLPASAVVGLKTIQEGGQYLSRIDIENVPSAFDSTPNCHLALYVEARPGGGLRMMLSCRKRGEAADIRVSLLDDVSRCEWRAFDPATSQWTTVWDRSARPALIELSTGLAGDQKRWMFWISPNESAS